MSDGLLDLFKITTASVSSVCKLVVAQLRGSGDEGDDASAEPTDNAVFMQQLGVAALPTVRSTLRALGLRHGAEVWLLKVWDKTQTPTDVVAGETRVFACGKVTVAISLTADGAIHVASDGGDVVVNGGTHAVHRAGDAVAPSADLTTWINAVSTALAATPPPSLALSIGTASGGAPNFRA